MTLAVFHPEALRELQEQVAYYEQQSPGLGERFLAQVEAAARIAVAMPGVGSPYRHGTRRVFPKDFPHSVVYRMVGYRLVILAIAPFRRKPGYWGTRL
ncbi:MAG: type II toxin-antitoxin system RelE/ParE family toxin [Hydrogenophaga sp.]|uniref:type II toxin-antitoxin system RelE/ParE family toxin n=1 Tax=Hydrogenophaga sp. TaxID=1904254 RepID=UPI0025803B8F|nr:type II toxin-antitoxin system RelE/ParE family toxin [Hydrogenophaga sp.]MBL0943351.1 type II toxin-antitoxin system RelE/ParE family toxin [Hydrogenophaga sp.]